MTILITGASDGLGLALARVYTAKRRPVVAIGRRPFVELDSPPYPASHYLQMDLTHRDADATLLRELGSLGISGLDLIIHCAGIGYYGPPDQQSESGIERLVHLNLTVPVRLTQTLMTRLEMAKGKVVFIGSIAAALPCPRYATYAATKRGLEGFARSLRLEVHGRFRVQVIHPGAVRTRFHEKLGISGQELKVESFPSPSAVASRIANAIESKRAVVTIGAGNRAISRIARSFPHTVDRVLGRRG
jgi:short-subunit dehydrogenase